MQDNINFPIINSKLLFSIQISCARHLLFVIKDNPPLPCQSINFILFLSILHHKCQNNLPKPKISQHQQLCKFESDFRFVQFFFYTLCSLCTLMSYIMYVWKPSFHIYFSISDLFVTWDTPYVGIRCIIMTIFVMVTFTLRHMTLCVRYHSSDHLLVICGKLLNSIKYWDSYILSRFSPRRVSMCEQNRQLVSAI